MERAKKTEEKVGEGRNTDADSGRWNVGKTSDNNSFSNVWETGKEPLSGNHGRLAFVS